MLCAKYFFDITKPLQQPQNYSYTYFIKHFDCSKFVLKLVTKVCNNWVDIENSWLMSETDLLAMVQSWTIVELTMTLAFRKWMAKHAFESLEDFRRMKIQMKLVLNHSLIQRKFTILKTNCGEWLTLCSANLEKNLHFQARQSRSSQRTNYELFIDLSIFHHKWLNQLEFPCCSHLQSSPGCQKS